MYEWRRSVIPNSTKDPENKGDRVNLNKIASEADCGFKDFVIKKLNRGTVSYNIFIQKKLAV